MRDLTAPGHQGNNSGALFLIDIPLHCGVDAGQPIGRKSKLFWCYGWHGTPFHITVLADESRVDPVSGNAVLNGIPVAIERV